MCVVVLVGWGDRKKINLEKKMEENFEWNFFDSEFFNFFFSLHFEKLYIFFQ